MNNKIVTIIILIILVIGGAYFLFDTVSNNNSILGVSHFNKDNISFDYPSMWIKDNSTDYNLTFHSLFYTINLDIYDISDTSFEDQVDVFLHDNSDSEINYTVIKINEIMVDGQKAYDISSQFDKDGKFYYRVLVFESNNKMYIFGFLSDNLNTVNNDFNLVKNSIKLK
ncbi:hypothetical protein MBCUT_00180 [Methanobrevibacter cuticularis]|uniref:PsbP C-terminal domain-containing protein n=1 Tax=Methanobrevibacter cuticularis TaxID=47311 RepID=A0A166CZW1_9EURY|nr:hypothetical protein [Methanobrevibacter cuticularis]KZX17807.1 hypothetical protein MBCUT_00180 [Methanobrevibacter cuticularis]